VTSAICVLNYSIWYVFCTLYFSSKSSSYYSNGWFVSPAFVVSYFMLSIYTLIDVIYRLPQLFGLH